MLPITAPHRNVGTALCLCRPTSNQDRGRPSGKRRVACNAASTCTVRGILKFHDAVGHSFQSTSTCASYCVHGPNHLGNGPSSRLPKQMTCRTGAWHEYCRLHASLPCIFVKCQGGWEDSDNPTDGRELADESAGLQLLAVLPGPSARETPRRAPNICTIFWYLPCSVLCRPRSLSDHAVLWPCPSPQPSSPILPKPQTTLPEANGITKTHAMATTPNPPKPIRVWLTRKSPSQPTWPLYQTDLTVNPAPGPNSWKVC